MGRRPDEAMSTASIVVLPHDLALRVDRKDTGIGPAWHIDRRVDAVAQHEAMLVALRIDVDSAIWPGSLIPSATVSKESDTSSVV